MKRAVALFAMVTLLAGSLSGCANMGVQDQITVFSGVSGAVVGGVAGGLLGGGRGAMIGAALGTSVGLITGILVGKHVAERKDRFDKEEAWLEACLQQAQRNNEALTKYNQELKAEIEEREKQTRQLQADLKANKANQQQLIAERNKIEGQRKETTQVITNV